MNLSEVNAKMFVSILPGGGGERMESVFMKFWRRSETQIKVKKHSAEFQAHISEHRWPRLGE